MSQRRSFTELSSQYLSSLASVSPIGIFHTDLDGRVSYINHRWTIISGQSVPDSQGFGWLNAIHPADRQHVWYGWLESATAGREYMTNYRVVRPDGTIRHVHVRVAPVTCANGQRQGYVGIVEDVTDRQTAEHALRELMCAREESQRRIQALFDNSRDAIVFANDDSRYVDANPAACALFGYSHDELVTKRVADMVLQDDTVHFCEVWRTFLANGHQSGEFIVRRADGTTRVVEFHAVAHVLPATHLSILRDITERRAAQQAQQQYTKRLEILAAIDSAILAMSSPEAIADAAVAQVAHLFPVVRVSVSLFDHVRATGRVAALWSARPTKIAPGYEFPLSDAGIALDNVRPTLVNDLSAVGRGPIGEVLLEEGIRSYVRVPLCVPGEVMGTLNISSDAPEALSEEHLSVGQEVADRLAVALRDARLFEHLQSSARQMSILSKRLLEVQDRERRDFARELHDEIGQLVMALKLQLGRMRGQAAPHLAASMRRMELLTDDLVATVRRVALNLRPPMLDEFGLHRALSAYFDRFVAQTGIRVEFDAPTLVDARLPPEVETAAFRIVQEALTNVARHAGVANASVHAATARGMLSMRISDAGDGFAPSHTSTSGCGLVGMKERVELLGGHFRVMSRPGEGTTITVMVPLNAQP